jgi:putative endonuclease
MHTGMSTTAVYMMASRKHGTLYIGVTGRFIPRISQHREMLKPGFTSRYGVTRLVWYEMYEAIVPAIQREKSLKKYKREWKINLIERDNPNWEDLYDGLFACPPPFPSQTSWPGLSRPPMNAVTTGPSRAQGTP